MLEVLCGLRKDVSTLPLPLAFSDELACCCYAISIGALRSTGRKIYARDPSPSDHRQVLGVSVLIQDSNGAAVVEDEVLRLTGQIVSDHVANNEVAMRQLPAFIREVHHALTVAGQTAPEPTKPEPAATAQKSVFADHLLCLDCGRSFKTLKRHILADHQMTPNEYRTKWSLPPSYPMVAADYAASRSQLPRDSGLGRKVAPPPPKTRGRAKPGQATSRRG
jgi:predicted transcriptional regulator